MKEAFRTTFWGKYSDSATINNYRLVDGIIGRKHSSIDDYIFVKVFDLMNDPIKYLVIEEIDEFKKAYRGVFRG